VQTRLRWVQVFNYHDVMQLLLSDDASHLLTGSWVRRSMPAAARPQTGFSPGQVSGRLALMMAGCIASAESD